MKRQALQALELANGTRQRKAAMKEKIRCGDVDAAFVARHTELPFKVGELLMCVRGLGEIKARRICRENHLPYTALVASNRAPATHILTDRQREVLADAIELFEDLRGLETKVRMRITRERLAA